MRLVWPITKQWKHLEDIISKPLMNIVKEVCVDNIRDAINARTLLDIAVVINKISSKNYEYELKEIEFIIDDHPLIYQPLVHLELTFDL